MTSARRSDAAGEGRDERVSSRDATTHVQALYLEALCVEALPIAGRCMDGLQSGRILPWQRCAKPARRRSQRISAVCQIGRSVVPNGLCKLDDAAELGALIGFRERIADSGAGKAAL